MTYHRPSIAQLVELIRTAQTTDQLAYLHKMTGDRLHLPQFRNALFERLTSLLHNQTAQLSADYVQQDGICYDLSQWITFSEYAQQYGLQSTNIINNWVSRGVVPKDCLIKLRQLNGLKLIRNQPYKQVESYATSKPSKL